MMKSPGKPGSLSLPERFHNSRNMSANQSSLSSQWDSTFGLNLESGSKRHFKE